jgi:uncharacterized protein YaaN involved in tellurite resistance
MPEQSEPMIPAESTRTSPGHSLGNPVTGGAADEPATADVGSDSETADDATDLEIEPDAAERIERLVGEQVETIVSTDARSPLFRQIVAAIERLGERDFVTTAAISGRVLDRRFRAMGGLLAGKAPIARRLSDLRKAADDLDPAALRLGGGRSPHDEIHELDHYFERFARTQPRLEAILGELRQARFALDQDNAAIASEMTSLAAEMATLRQYAFMAGRMDAKMTARVEQLAPSEPARATALQTDVLVVVRRRRTEILTQLAIATQGYAALRMVEDNNAEVIDALASAVSTTAAALNTAVMVAQAAASQRMALEHLEAARLAAGTMAENAAVLEAGLTGPEGRVATLKAAWDEVHAALDRVEAQKARVRQTIASADRELTRSKTAAP